MVVSTIVRRAVTKYAADALNKTPNAGVSSTTPPVSAPKLSTPVSPHNKMDTFVGTDSKHGPVFADAKGKRYNVVNRGDFSSKVPYAFGAPTAADFLNPADPNAPPQTFTPAEPSQQQPVASPTPTTSGQPAMQNAQPPAPPPAAQAPQPAQPAAKPFDNFEQTFKAAPREQQVQVAQQAVQQHMPNVPPEEQKGVQDLAAGANTPEAKMFEQKVNETGQKVMQEQVDQQIQANPELAASPQGFGQLWNQASDMWNSMPQEAKWMVGLGIPLGAAGLMSSLFGEGGMAGGLLGLLGLGAAGLGAAGSGVLGQDAQNMTTDALYNVGTFFGAMPEKADFSALKGPDAMQKLTAGPTTGEAAATWWDPKAKAQEVQGQLDQADQLGKLMMVPEGMRARLIQKMDPSLSPEEAQQIAANAAQAHSAMQDPESALAKKLQQGSEFVANPEGYVNQQAWNAVNPMNWFKSGSTNMDIQYLISRWAEKTAFNDVDAKEMADLKAQQAEGVPYRVEDARRLNALEKRQQAEAPLKKEVVISVCQKAARCWAGYEPVPGAKAYSKGSCRPKGSKKTQKEMKKT